jgi:hypothetical protein
MNRSEFLRKLGIGIGVVVVTPQVFAQKEDMIYPRLADGVTIDTDLLPIKKSAWEELAHMDMSEPPYFKELKRKYPLTEKECYQSECQRIKLLNKQEKEIADITLPNEFAIRFWDRITHDRHYIVTQRTPKYWIAIEA